jgi:hypothetical protein
VPWAVDEGSDRGIPGIMSTPVYGEDLSVVHVAPRGPGGVATVVANVQAAAGWRSAVYRPSNVPGLNLDVVDVVVLWGMQAGRVRRFVAGRRPTVMVLGTEEARRILSQPIRWLAESCQARNTNLLLLPAEIAERYARWGPPVPLAHRPDGLPEVGAVTMLSAWTARAYAFGRRHDAGSKDRSG